MLNKILAGLLILVVPTLSFADAISASAIKQASIMQKAYIAGDYKTFTKYNHPKLVEQLGGEEKFTSTISEAMSKMGESGISVKSATVGSAIDKVEKDGVTYVSMSVELVLTTPKSDIAQTSTLIGFSKDTGTSWNFIDVSKDLNSLRTFFPEIPAELKVPERSPFAPVVAEQRND